MIDLLVDFSARHRKWIVLVTAIACICGWFAMRRVPLDAIPDLSETQVIVASRWDRDPGQMEDQVTNPIVTALTGRPKVRTVRAISDFGYSYVYVIFDEGTDLFWARTRVQEVMAAVIPTLPTGVTTSLGPDATSLGWIFQYALVDKTGTHNPAELRSIQDWYLRSHLRSVRGVSEVASLG
jgi:Cu(I)/Ag(I) efflux system membrane protein CusA/SilA